VTPMACRAMNHTRGSVGGVTAENRQAVDTTPRRQPTPQTTGNAGPVRDDATGKGLTQNTFRGTESSRQRTVHCGAATTLAQVHFLRAEYRDALRWADEALEMAERIANVAGLSGPAAIAVMARVELGLPVDAERYLALIEQSLTGGETLQSNSRFAGEAFLAVGEPARAERYAESLRATRRGGRLREAYAAASIGEIMLRRGRFAESERAIGHAISVAKAIGARSVLAAACITGAELAEAVHAPSLGTEPLERAIPICRELRLERYLARAEKLRAGSGPTAARA